MMWAGRKDRRSTQYSRCGASPLYSDFAY
ncbi:hypothetical protein CO2235_MP130006 [Cupriavidus oxalaticus]|uniref:Uncharacterized protein n=1 Tax=Cupriavidus oxalaticus TaxID=96344 RepID=A0A375GJB1_9BURK|nr:hypothetical protein CO2235_U220007 [Cupriavidus oxalaticus]SPC19271.1 hypothetical protein CO2235_MP130006 [Cupriavidus oxalaticus]